MTYSTTQQPYWSDYSLSDYYSSPQWRERSKRFWAKHERKCCACSSRWRVQIHHLRYPRTRRQWGTERDSWLRPLCAECHRKVTSLHRKWGPGSIPKATQTVINHERRKRFYRWVWRNTKRAVRLRRLS